MYSSFLFIFAILIFTTTNAFKCNPSMFHNKHKNQRIISIFAEKNQNSQTNIPIVPISSVVEEFEEINTDSELDILAQETPEEKYKREKLAEIAEKKSKEVFVERVTGKFECQACGYIYDEAIGLASKGIPPKTSFDTIEKFRCPSCGASKKYFVAETETVSGFKENLKFGFGGNSMTGESKSGLIYGGLFLGFLALMSGYLME